MLQLKPFKNDEKCFVFHLESSFHSQDIQIFVLTFWSSRKNGLIRKIKLILKFMMSQSSQKTIKIHILPIISRCKGNQAMTFGQVMEDNKRNVFFKYHAENE